MSWQRNSGLLLSAVLFFSESLQAVELNSSTAQLSIPTTDKSIKIDADLSDPAWQKALTVNLNIVNNPWNNKKSPVKTTAKIIENGEFLYLSFKADDPHPEKIKGFLSDRDTTMGDDIVGIKLDTFNNHRILYQFFVNPYGVQNDAIANENTGDVNTLWDGIWQSYGKITPEGYQVEMAIPFNILNFAPSNNKKTWSIELIRLYPRDERLRISHLTLDRNNNCWACQMVEATGFKQAKVGKNIQITPYTALAKNQSTDIYNPNDSWHNDNQFDAGVDVKWGVTPNNTLSATLNPDFSTVESDSGQLSANKNFSLFYDEKRAFFLENADYFKSNYNLVYTRNIADPDYGLKFTGRKNQHTYGFFATNDTQTNIILPGNLGSSIRTLNQESKAAAFNYRYNYSDDLSFGLISTYRSADSYHNLVTGIDSKYRLDESNSIKAQLLSSDTQDDPSISDNLSSKSDVAYKINFLHESEFWTIDASKQQINKNFRADLGYMPQNDFEESAFAITRQFYGDENSWWSEASAEFSWDIQHNQQGDLIEVGHTSTAIVKGPLLSTFIAKYTKKSKVGLRFDETNKTINYNTDRFTEEIAELYGSFQPTARLFVGAGIDFGNKIDYSNNRLGNYQEIYGYVTWNLTDHFLIDLSQAHSELKADNPAVNLVNTKVYTEDLTDLRFSYQFDVRSYLKLNLVYSDISRNPNNFIGRTVQHKDKGLSTQLIYSYQINPQTVFFLGYSDSSYQDDDLMKLEREQRTFFSKISYAWQP